MKGLGYILLFEDFDFSPLSEDLETKIKQLEDRKTKFKNRIASMGMKTKESSQKAAKFKEKASKTNDPLTQKIYTNRATEEQMAQQVYLAKVKAMQMADKLNDMQIKTATLKKTQKELTKSNKAIGNQYYLRCNVGIRKGKVITVNSKVV